MKKFAKQLLELGSIYSFKKDYESLSSDWFMALNEKIPRESFRKLV